MYRKRIITMMILLVTSVSSQAENDGKNLSYSIALNKNNYLSLEPIIIISRLKNIITEPIEVNEPSGNAYVVTYDLYRIDPNGRQEVGLRVMGGGGPAWNAQIFILKPNEECESSCELQWQIQGKVKNPPGLQVGEYIIKATYHFGRYGTQKYRDKVLSSEATFQIIERNSVQEVEYNELVKSITEEMVSGKPEYNVRISKLEAFIKKYPYSPYKQLVLDTLSIDLNYLKDYKRMASYYQEELKGLMSTGRRERTIYSAASSLLLSGNVDGAIKVLSEDKDKHPRSIWLKEQLEKGQIPQEYKKALENAN